MVCLFDNTFINLVNELMGISEEALFYNGVNSFFESSYSKLAEVKSKFGSWKKAWNSLAKKELPKIPTPISLALFEEKGFPELLKEIPNPPFGIYTKGTLDPGNSLSIVGTRKATDEGKRLANEFAKDLSSHGFSIVSGLAFGIDKSAHEGALSAGGKTIAVLANGLNSVYPQSNKNLANKILENGGALVSEYAPDIQPMPFRFLERNRIVSGLSRGTIVIEAPLRSGSLVTARFALDQNRDVFVVPGYPRHPNYKGSHELIRSGATLITEPNQVLEEYGANTSEKTAPLASSEEKIILDVLRDAGRPLPADTIAQRAKMDIKDANRILSFMLIGAKIKENSEGYNI